MTTAIQTGSAQTFAQFTAWCEEKGIPAIISKSSYLGFNEELRITFANGTAKRKMRELYRVGISGADLEARDYLFANNPDLRSVDEILQEPWWPTLPRVLASVLEISERKRVIQELDNFFRWQQRCVGDQPRVQLQRIFLDDNMSLRTRYQRLSRLCRGLDTVLPGNEDLTRLRELQSRLATQVWPPKGVKTRQARRIPEIEALLCDLKHWRTGEPLKGNTVKRYRLALQLHFDLLAAEGRPLTFDRTSLNTFADHVWSKLGAGVSKGWSDKSREGPANGKRWTLYTASTMCQSLIPFIRDRDLKRSWYQFAHYFEKKAAGDVKAKERALAEKSTSLEELFILSSNLQSRADAEMKIQVRHGILTVLGALGVLLFFPLRQGDLRRMRIGVDLIRKCGRWTLMPGATDKTGLVVNPIVLPEEGNDLLDVCLLAGASRSRLPDIYKERAGTPLIKSPRLDGAYHSSAFTVLFKRWTGHTPHILRTIWCDELVSLGADRSKIGIMLQHRSPITQEEYQVVSSKIRRIRAIEALGKIEGRVTASEHDKIRFMRPEQ